jgi:hypothetical protein
MSMIDFQSFSGPGDRNLNNSLMEGYQPVSRIGEGVMNAFVDAYEFTALEDQMSHEMTGANNGQANAFEYKPMFHEWATVQPGMVCLARKKRTAVFRNYVAAETAVPVIACAACLPIEKENDFFFAGVARSKSVRSPDDGIGPSQDEFFTLSIGGMATMLNTSSSPLHPGDLIEWTFANADTSPAQRSKQGPRRFSVAIATVSSPKVIGRCLSFAKKGEVRAARPHTPRVRFFSRAPCSQTFDLLIKQ